MVKLDTSKSISDEYVEPSTDIVNDNGKRPASVKNKDGIKRVKYKSLYRQPTATELNRLQETESLFNSNLFRFQVEEVLTEVKVKEKTVKRFHDWFNTFKNYLLAIPENDTEYDLSENTFAKQYKVKLPISKESKTTKVLFKFYKFKDVEIVGSYSLGCSINSKLIINLQCTVPADTYTKNDSINYKYHKKRAAYLAYVAAYLKKLNMIDELKFTWLNGDQTKPVIDIKPTGKLSNHLLVRLNLACELEAYKLHRFSPTRNNLREGWLFSTNDESSDMGTQTPYYNNSVLSDLTATTNQEFLKDIFLNCENLKQAVVLLKIWARQRKLQVSGYVLSMVVAYLVQAKRINNIMSSYQIVRNVWIALKSSEWDVKGISLNKDSNTPSLEEFHQNFPVVFLDVTGYYNMCWQMCIGTYNALRRESSLAVEMLDNSKVNSFIPLFMTPVSSLMQFDHIVRFKSLSEVKESIISKVSKEVRLNYGLNDLPMMTDTLYSLLTKGLTNRVDLISQIVEADFSCPINKSLEKAKKESNYEEKLSFGFVLNPENAINIVDRGPPANLPEAEEFRAFWGEKSELRRFQDGAITEACVWEADSLAERRSISKQIVNHLLHLKYGISPSAVTHICDQLNPLTRLRAGGWAEEGSLRVLQALDELRRDLRALQLPLGVSAVLGVSPVFSYAEPLAGAACAAGAAGARPARRRGATGLLKDAGAWRLPAFVPANRVVLELSHSGKWPGDLDAFRCLKAAFHLQIAERLKQQYSLPTQVYPTHVDVLKNGAVFRLEVAHPKEITLLRREVEKGVVKFKDSEESIRLLQETVVMPRLRGALHGLHQKHPAFGPTACLLKRWVSSQLLAPQFPAPLLERLAAAVFVAAAPAAPPVQPTLAFLRVLRLIAEKDWASEVLVLDFNDDLSREEITEIERKFSERGADAPAMCVVTAYDAELPSPSPSLSPSASLPSPPAVARLQALARASLQHAEEEGTNMLSAFVPSLAGYDVLIHLHERLVPLACERLDSPAPAPARERLDSPAAEELMPVVEFDPVEKYFQELQHAYGEFALFFRDAYGGAVLAALWRPAARAPRPLQIANANALKPAVINGENTYVVNFDAIIEDFKILGAGLVKEVVVIN